VNGRRFSPATVHKNRPSSLRGDSSVLVALASHSPTDLGVIAAKPLGEHPTGGTGRLESDREQQMGRRDELALGGDCVVHRQTQRLLEGRGVDSEVLTSPPAKCEALIDFESQ